MVQDRSTLPEAGLIRLRPLLALIPVSKSSWWAGVKSGQFPKPVRLGPRTTAWKIKDIRALLDRGVDLEGGR
jgi:predicted DNA-binding transcriptional regulator AlpA